MAALTLGTRRLRVVLFASGLLLAFTLVPASTALAAPGETTSCMGHEASDITPPGSNEEFPDGMVGLREEVRAIAASLGGVPVGQVYRIVASLHEGSHAACDVALGG
jgi:hypothetical protein